MIVRASRLAATVMALALLTSGCALQTLPTGAGGGKTGTGTGTNVTGDGPVHNLPLEPLNGVEFKPISADTSRYIANNGGIVAAGGGNLVSNGTAGAVASKAAVAPAAAPMAAGASADGAALVARDSSGGGVSEAAVTNAGGGAYSGNVWSYYGYYGGYFGGYGDQQMALVSLQQAELPGNAGSFADVVGTTCAPVVKAWATDARLVSSTAQIDNGGALLKPQNEAADAKMAIGMPYGGYGDPSGWNLTYASTKRLEVLSFTVTGSKTTVIRMRWEPLNLDPARVLTDSATAVKKVIAAIKDKGFKGEEETTGKDCFLGFPFDQPKTGQWDGDYQRTEVVYDVPANAQWNVNLQEVMGKLVWNLSFYAPYDNVAVPIARPGIAVATTAAAPPAEDAKPVDPQPCTTTTEEQPGWFNNSAQAMVDAESGKVIRFSRPTRSFYKQTINKCDVPTPAATPLPPDAGTAVSVDKK
jgi:hypothetical protein